MTSPDAIPHDDAPAAEPLPQQEAVFRPAVRFGNIPVVRAPLGWSERNKGFRNHYPFISLPLQIADRVQFGAPELEPNRLIWGDCLHVMRQLPDASVDLIYIDPPFYSGREYNLLWGDANERRSFPDTWESGLDGYLIWLNARLYEMKRLLKPAGSIYVHCDWHASHYIKVELDNIFGYGNFRNEIVWAYTGPSNTTQWFPRKHDTILFYVKSNSSRFNRDAIRIPYDKETLARRGRIEGEQSIIAPSVADTTQRRDIQEVEDQFGQGKVPESYWTDIAALTNQRERIGYPTQKPEALLERIIKASSNEGDVVADFLVGGGTTAAVAQRLGRRFIACDQSRVAVSVTAERLKQAAQGRLNEAQYPDFTIEQWGVYEAFRLADASPEEFRKFVLECYDARIPSDDEGIHGYKGAPARIPVWVGQPALGATVTMEDVNGFAQAIGRLPRYESDDALRDGIMLAWGFSPDAVSAAEELRGRGKANVAFVRIEQVRIDSPAFSQHIRAQSTGWADYSNFLTFVEPPDVTFAHRRLKSLRYAFDASDTQAYMDAKVISVQWDFAFDGAFRAARRRWADRAKLTLEHQFPRAGTYAVACKVQDDKGGEGMRVAKVEVK